MRLTDKHGNTAVTAPYFVRNAAKQQLVGRFSDVPGIAGTALAMGALTAAFSEPTLLGKVLAASLLGAVSVGAFSLRERNRENGTVTTEAFEEIPVSTITGSWKFAKTAATGLPRFGTVAGLALPPALALDYAYNKWRYGAAAEPKNMELGVGRIARTAGRFVKDHPVLTTIGSGLVGSQLLRMPRFGRRIVPTP